MSQIKLALEDALRGCFQRLGLDQAFATVQQADRPDLADYQCNGALALAKKTGRSPRDLAAAIVGELSQLPHIGAVSIAGPGFINFVLHSDFICEHLRTITDDRRMGIALSHDRRRVIIDYGGPNIAKPMHVGHLRSSIIGESLKRIVAFKGHEVISDIHLGDWGTQMGMLIRAIQRRTPHLPYFDPNFSGEYPTTSPVTLAELEELYPQISAECESNEDEARACSAATAELQNGRRGYRALWAHFVEVSLEAVRRDLSYLDVTFDQWFGESRYQDRIPSVIERLLQRGYARAENEAVVVDFQAHDKDSDLPRLVIRKSDGGFLYSSTDLATIDERVNEFGGEVLLYVVDARQSLHFQQVFRAARDGGIAPRAAMEHIEFGTMNGADGKPFKTRAGGVMKLQDLIQMLVTEARARIEQTSFPNGAAEAGERTALRVGIAALKFADLQHDRAQNYVFNLEKFSRFEGKTGPYILYSIVRIKSLLDLARERKNDLGKIVIRMPEERALALQLLTIDQAVTTAYDQRKPHHLCEFAYKLCQRFNALYQSCRILDASEEGARASRLALCRLVQEELELICHLLAISVPDRM
jgi:arginyl-tRNA synthetase